MLVWTGAEEDRHKSYEHWKCRHPQGWLSPLEYQKTSKITRFFQAITNNIQSGIDLILNYDKKMAEIEDNICGPDGKAQQHSELVEQTSDAFHRLKNDAEMLESRADNQRIRAEAFKGEVCVYFM